MTRCKMGHNRLSQLGGNSVGGVSELKQQVNGEHSTDTLNN